MARGSALLQCHSWVELGNSALIFQTGRQFSAVVVAWAVGRNILESIDE